jgi:hypothetical protein
LVTPIVIPAGEKYDLIIFVKRKTFSFETNLFKCSIYKAAVAVHEVVNDELEPQEKGPGLLGCYAVLSNGK